MLNFIYNTPTKVYFGKDTHLQIGAIVKELGYKKIMMQYGKNSIKKNGLYDEVINSLSDNGIEVVECGGVEPNPKLSFVRDAVKLAKAEKVEMILAVGGGSVLDSSKSTALAALSNYDAWEIQMGKVTVDKALPVACILTHSAAGSEMSRSSVITDTETMTKKGIGSDFNRCKFAILNPELTYSVSKYQTACGIVDMLTHTMERYFTPIPPVDITDRLSESLLKSVIKAGRTAITEPQNYEARATLMWGSSLLHNGLTDCGRDNIFTVHPIEHAVSGIYDSVAHGAGLAVLYPAWARYVYKYAPERFSDFARNVFDVNKKDDMTCALMGIEAMERYFAEIGMPRSLSEFGIPKDAIEALANHATQNDTIKIRSYIPLGKREVSDILALSF